MKQFLPLFFIFSVFAAVAGINYFLAYSFTAFFDLSNLRMLFWILNASILYMFYGVMGRMNARTVPGRVLHISAAIYMGFYLYVLLATTVVVLLSTIVPVDPLLYGTTVLSLATLTCIYGLWNAAHTRIKEVEITMNGLKQNLRVAHLTDTHLGHFRGRKKLQEIVKRINEQDVELVLFTGDLLDSRIQLKADSMQPLQDLRAPVYFVEGNHDRYTGVNAIKGYLKSIGIHVLENQLVRWNGIQLIGLNHMVGDHRRYDMHAGNDGPSVEKSIARLDINKKEPAILLHHAPNGIKHAQASGIDLYLAGHTHGGQMWPLTLIAKRIFEYNRGLHDYLGMKIYISQGTGTFGPPMRVGTSSELTVLQLKKG